MQAITINKILIANRGEIACRIIRTCKKMGIESVAVFSDADKNALHVQQADQSVYIGPSEVNQSYLNMEQIINVAQKTGADAIHPGYGFLSENAAFAKKVDEAGLIFVGPNADAIHKMGSKSLAKEIAINHKVPTIPGYKGADQSVEKLKAEALKIGFPILIKAAAGGGGKGMRIIHEEKELKSAIESAQSEAKNAFGNDELLIEKYLPNSRHIEIQIFGDKQGNAIHLFERECTIQRRYQKIFEESPSPVLDEKTRKEMGDAAVRMAKALKYDNAGTVEFIYENGAFYFLEVNTRLQVEHPVTEAITGLDLVEWQILAAEGSALPLEQEDVKKSGYALECRLYAEDAAQDFMPATGKVLKWTTPDIEGVRYDSGIQSGDEVSVYYDPMLSKIIAYGENRNAAIRKMQYALKQTICLGTTTNLPFLQHILSLEAFSKGDYNTQFIEQKVKVNQAIKISKSKIELALIAATADEIITYKKQDTVLNQLPFAWRNNFYQPLSYTFIFDEDAFTVEVTPEQSGYRFKIGETAFKVSVDSDNPNTIFIDEVRHRFDIARQEDKYFIHHKEFSQIELQKQSRFPDVTKDDAAGGYVSSMPASVIKVMVKAGDEVEKGQALLVLSSMKMENSIIAEDDGTVEEVFVSEGENIESGRELIKMKEK